MTLWRISNRVSLAGDGGLWTSGRWHTRGRRIVYCSQSPAAALLEVLVHFEIDIQDLPTRYRLLKLHAPDDLSIEEVTPRDLPEDWLERTDLTCAMGDRWLEAGRSSLLTVPSGVVPETFNVLLNPTHHDAERVVIVQVTDHAIDPRLVRQTAVRYPSDWDLMTKRTKATQQRTLFEELMSGISAMREHRKRQVKFQTRKFERIVVHRPGDAKKRA